MKHTKIMLILMMALIAIPVQSLNKSAIPQKSSIIVTGTSTLHDWEMKVSNILSSFTINLVDAQQLEFSNARLTFKANHLQSDNSGLDEKAHEALKAEKHQMISFTQTEKIVVKLSNNQFKSKVRGNLNIAGSTKPVELEIEGEQLPDGSFRVKGEKALKMTTFGVTPPKAMLGAIRSGDDIVVRFDVTFK